MTVNYFDIACRSKTEICQVPVLLLQAFYFHTGLNREECNILTILCSNKDQQTSDEGCPSFCEKCITVLIGERDFVDFLEMYSNNIR